MTNKDFFLRKFVTCFIAGLTAIALLLMLGNSGTLPWFPPVVVFSLAGVLFVTSIIYPFIWQYLERKQKVDSDKVYGILYATIRYTVAFNLASFGWKKMYGLQFNVPVSISAKPMNEQTGEWLTWFYFGHSYAFGIIIALIQIFGSYLLLFRKTFLLAAIVLFTFMLNLTLINFFYQLNAGALTQSVLLTTGIAFLISLEYNRLVTFFFKENANVLSVTVRNSLTKNVIRLLAIVLSLSFTLLLKYVFVIQQH